MKSAFESASVIGKIAGFYVMVSGGTSTIESILKLRGDNNAPDILKDGYVNVAKFMGFDKKAGLTAYHSMEVISSAYGVFRMSLKSKAWRLYKFIPSDFHMQVNRMSKALLTLKGVGAGNEIRLISEMYSDD